MGYKLNLGWIVRVTSYNILLRKIKRKKNSVLSKKYALLALIYKIFDKSLIWLEILSYKRNFVQCVLI